MFYYVSVGILLLFALAIGFTVVWAFLSLAPWVPVRKRDLPRLSRLAGLKDGEVFYDLGCGNGRVVMYMKKRFPAAETVGVELAWPFYFICRLRQTMNRLPGLSFKFGNLFAENLNRASVVYLFGLPEKLSDRLRQKFEQELKPGSRVISYTFPIQGWPVQTVDKPTDNDIAIYLYRI